MGPKKHWHRVLLEHSASGIDFRQLSGECFGQRLSPTRRAMAKTIVARLARVAMPKRSASVYRYGAE
jgi:hypothetical protein